MLNRRMERAGNILDQRPSEKNIHALDAVTDGQDGFVFGEGMLEKGKICAFAVSVSFSGRRIPRCAVERRVDVGGATGQNDSIE